MRILLPRNLFKLAGWVLFNTFLVTTLRAQTAYPQFQADSLQFAKINLRYRYYIPTNHNGAEKQPLIVWLHGYGAIGNDNTAQLDTKNGVDGNYWADSIGKKHGAALLAPQCPKKKLWVNFLSRKARPSLKAVEALISPFVRKHNLDSTRIYLIGHSMGAFATWALLGRQPERYAGAVAVSGSVRTDILPKIVRVPVWMFHGRKDKLVPVCLSRCPHRKLNRIGAPVRYTEFPDGTHEIFGNVVRMPKVWDWLLSQQLRP
jgi:predicted peptidase